MLKRHPSALESWKTNTSDSSVLYILFLDYDEFSAFSEFYPSNWKMHFSKIALLTAGASLVNGISMKEHDAIIQAFNAAAAKRNVPSLEDLSPRQAINTSAVCPAVWTQVAADLTNRFLNTTSGQCNDDARASIRAAFHDCAAWNTTTPGGCDGSLILSSETADNELDRPENNGLQDIGAKLLNLTQTYQAIDSSVTAADMIQFAASVAIVTCPLGPKVPTVVGRTDSSQAAVPDLLPNVNSPAADLIALFEAKTITAPELIALIGAHSTSRQFNTNLTFAGEPQDSTPGEWDVDFYAQTTNPPEGVFVFPSDRALALDNTTAATFEGFVGAQGKWNFAFKKA